jgi:hypothetical protein
MANCSIDIADIDLVLNYPHRNELKGMKSGEHAGQENGASRPRPILGPG